MIIGDGGLGTEDGTGMGSRPQTLRVTPAMEAGITDHVWEFEEIVALLEKK